MQELGYSFSLTVFSPTGQLWQIQHALAACDRGRLSIGIKARNGVVLLTQRKLDEQSEVLIDQSTIKLIENIAPHIGITYSGLQADFRPILAAAREYAVMYEATYKQPIPVKILCKELAALFQEKTQQGGVRPFGCSLMICGYDYVENNQGDIEKTHSLYQLDPSGSYFKLHCWANGKNNENVRQQLEKKLGQDLNNPELDDSVVAGLGLMTQNCELELTSKDIVVGIYQNETFRKLTPDEVEQYFNNIQ